MITDKVRQEKRWLISILICLIVTSVRIFEYFARLINLIRGICRITWQVGLPASVILALIIVVALALGFILGIIHFVMNIFTTVH